MKIFNLINSKGISVIFLVIAMLLMVIIGYVFSYLIPSKQKSVVFPISSTQAFFIAQSGVEFAVRFATVNGWTTPAQLLSNLNNPPNNTRTLGAGSFTLTYTNAAPYLDTLFSVGEVPTGTVRRSIRVSNFTSFLPQLGLVLWIEPGVYQEPCYPGSNTTIRFYIKNIGSLSITLNSFSASWFLGPANRQLNTITMDSNSVFSGTYNNGSGITSFTPAGNNQTINPNQVVMVLVVWNRNIAPNLPVNISFYDNSIPSNQYRFDNLAPTGNCTY